MALFGNLEVKNIFPNVSERSRWSSPVSQLSVKCQQVVISSSSAAVLFFQLSVIHSIIFLKNGLFNSTGLC